MEEIIGRNTQTIKTGLMLMAYEEHKDGTRQSDVVKQGIYASDENVEYGASIDIRNEDFWSDIIKEGYREKIKEYLGDDFEYVESVMENIGEFDILKGKSHKESIVETSKYLSVEPVRVAIQNRMPRTVEERKELADGFKSLVSKSQGDYDGEIVSVKDYESAEEISVKQYKQIIGTNFINKDLGRNKKELLQDALHNKLQGALDKPENLVSRTYLNFKDEYEGMLGVHLGIDMDIKFIGIEDNENQDLLNNTISYINSLNNSLSKALGTGILEIEGIQFDDKGDIIVGETSESIIKIKVFNPMPGDTMFRVEYVNDKRKNNFGKIKDVLSFKIDKNEELKEDKDDYLKYILRIS